jgi:hypothetical protein
MPRSGPTSVSGALTAFCRILARLVITPATLRWTTSLGWQPLSKARLTSSYGPKARYASKAQRNVILRLKGCSCDTVRSLRAARPGGSPESESRKCRRPSSRVKIGSFGDGSQILTQTQVSPTSTQTTIFPLPPRLPYAATSCISCVPHPTSSARAGAVCL